MIGSAWLHLASFAVMLVAIRAVRRWPWLYALSVLPGTLAHDPRRPRLELGRLRFRLQA